MSEKAPMRETPTVRALAVALLLALAMMSATIGTGPAYAEPLSNGIASAADLAELSSDGDLVGDKSTPLADSGAAESETPAGIIHKPVAESPNVVEKGQPSAPAAEEALADAPAAPAPDTIGTAPAPGTTTAPPDTTSTDITTPAAPGAGTLSTPDTPGAALGTTAPDAIAPGTAPGTTAPDAIAPGAAPGTTALGTSVAASGVLVGARTCAPAANAVETAAIPEDAAASNAAHDPAADPLPAYAVYDEQTQTLTFARGDAPQGSYTGFETSTYRQAQVPWRGLAASVAHVVFDDSIAPISTAYWFSGFVSLQDIVGLDRLDLAGATSVKAMFQNCASLSSVDVASWDVSNVQDMGMLFASCRSLTSVDTSGWDTSSVTSMNLMFSAAGITAADLRHFDVSNVRAFGQLFSGCLSLRSVDVTGWDTSSGTAFNGMFQRCESLSYILGLNGFNTSNGLQFDSMFEDCTSLTYLDLSSFDTSKAQVMASMFDNCNRLNTVKLGPGWSPRLPGYRSGIPFAANEVSPVNYRPLLVGEQWINVSTDQIATVEELRDDYEASWAGTWTQYGQLTAVLYDDGDLVFQRGTDLDWDKANVLGCWVDFVTRWYTFNERADAPWLSQRAAIKHVVVNADFEVPFMDSWFDGCSNLADIVGFNRISLMNPIGHIPASNNPREWATGSMENAFRGCASLQHVDLSSFDAANVTSTRYMFSGCASLRAVDLRGWNVAHLKDASFMFNGCRALEDVKIAWSKADKLATVRGMFVNCSSLADVDLSGIVASKLENAGRLFERCAALVSADVSGFVMNAAFDAENNRVITVTEGMLDARTPLQSLTVGEGFRFNGVTLPGEWFVPVPTGVQLLSGADATSSYDGSQPGTFVRYGCKAVLFDDGNLTFFLSSDDVDESHAVAIYDNLVNEQGAWVTARPWANEAALIKVVTFARPMSPTSVASWFQGCSSLVAFVGLDLLDTSKVVSFANMFAGCTALASLDASGFDTSNARTLAGMFRGCAALKHLNASTWDLSNVGGDGLAELFSGCRALERVDAEGWRIPQGVSALSYTFSECGSLRELDASAWGLAGIRSLYCTFANCSSLESLGKGSWQLASVSSMFRTFSNCSSLTELDVAGWDLASVEQFDEVFAGCTGLLGQVDVSMWDRSCVERLSSELLPYIATVSAGDDEGLDDVDESGDDIDDAVAGLAASGSELQESASGDFASTEPDSIGLAGEGAREFSVGEVAKVQAARPLSVGLAAEAEGLAPAHPSSASAMGNVQPISALGGDVGEALGLLAGEGGLLQGLGAVIATMRESEIGLFVLVADALNATFGNQPGFGLSAFLQLYEEVANQVMRFFFGTAYAPTRT